ncbi:hypothetical protein [Gluconobacter sphaericus]|uniref:hypothetical protein n=1 Tax=Gluconobacter sphaericus TaxID=574987 RepID=UPI0038D23FC8
MMETLPGGGSFCWGWSCMGTVEDERTQTGGEQDTILFHFAFSGIKKIKFGR